MLIILILVLLILAVSGVPTWGYPHNYGYWPSGALGLVIVVLLVLILLGRL